MYSIFAYEDYSGYVVLYKGSSLPDRYPVEEATLSEALNASPVLTFSIYDGHPALAALLRLIGAPGVYENSPTIVAHNESADDEKVFSGRIYSHQFDDVTGKHTFVCEGLLSRLNDYPVAPYSYSGTVAGYLQALFDHSEAALTVGNVTVADSNDYITRASETPVNLWDEIADKCIGSSIGGYIEIRDGYIVDWLAAPSASTATQDIEKGINLLGLDVEEQPRAKFSGVLIYGAEAGWENQYGQTMYYNLYQYHDWESSLPSGYTMGSYILWNDALREEIGDRVEILHYPDITQPLNLMRRAVSFLQNQADVQTIQVSAIDMVDAGYGDGIDNIKCGQVIHITGKTVDADRMVTAITRDLLDPSNTTFEFGGSDSISGSGGSGGSGGGGSMASPHFWHTDVENSQFSPSITEPYTGMSTLPLEDALTDIVGAYSEIDGGAVWLVNTPKHNNVPYDASALQIRANNLNARIVSASLPLYEAYLTLMGTSAMLGARYTNTTRARVSVDGYNGNVDITASNAVNVSADTNITGNLGVKNTVTLGTNTTAEENGIRVKGGGTRNGWVLRTISAANGDGDAVLLGDGGLTIVGAGESAANLWTALGVTAGDETLHLASDNSIQLHTNCGTIANRQTVSITANGSIIGPNNHVVKLAGVDSSASNNGVTATTYRYHSFIDESDRYIGWLGTAVDTEGNITTTVAARRRNGSANLDNVLSLGVTKNGTRTVAFSDKQLWRNALGLNTWTTVSAANWITWSSGWTGTTVSVQYNEALGVVRVYAYIKTSAAQTAGNKTLGTVAMAYRPKAMTVSIPSLTNGSHAAYLDTNGALKANISALSANGTLYFCGDYFIGA